MGRRIPRIGNEVDMVRLTAEANWEALSELEEVILNDERATDSARLLQEIQEDPELPRLTWSNGMTFLHVATNECQYDLAAYLLIHGADPNAYQRSVGTPLHCSCGDEALFSLLIQHGADVNLKDPSGQTPLDIARHYCAENIAQLLIQHGAKEPVPGTADSKPRRKRKS